MLSVPTVSCPGESVLLTFGDKAKLADGYRLCCGPEAGCKKEGLAVSALGSTEFRGRAELRIAAALLPASDLVLRVLDSSVDLVL